MKSFALDFQFGTNVLPEEDGENIIKYKNGYVYKEIFLPLNYQDTIGKMLIKTKFTEDIAKTLQEVTNINNFLYNNGVSDKEPFIVPTYDLIVNGTIDMMKLVDEIHGSFSTSYKSNPTYDSLLSFSEIIKGTNFKDLDVAARDLVSEETRFESLSKFTHNLPSGTLSSDDILASLTIFIKLVNTYLYALKNVKDKDFFLEVVLVDYNFAQYSNIINGRKVKFITETFSKLCSSRMQLRKEVASEANETKLLEVRNNYAVFIKKLEQLNKKAKASSVKKAHISEPNKSPVSK